MAELALMEESQFPGQEAPELPAQAGLVAESPYLLVDYTGWQWEEEEIEEDMPSAETAYAEVAGYPVLAQGEDVFPPEPHAGPAHVQPVFQSTVPPGASWLERSIQAGITQGGFHAAGSWMMAGTILSDLMIDVLRSA